MISQNRHVDMKWSHAAPEQLAQLTGFYRDAIDRNPDMPRFGRWIYGLHPTDEMIQRYVRSGAMYTGRMEEGITCAFALTPSQGSDYHDTVWERDLEDDAVAVVHLLCVDPQFRNRGLGHRAMKYAIELSREMGKKAVRLDALACNTPAHRLYESLGFQKRGMSHWFADNVGWTDFYLYELLL